MKLKLARLEAVGELYRRGCSFRGIQREVIARLGIKSYSLRTVKKDVDGLLSEWRENRLENTDRLIQLELERIDDAVRELWEQWDKHKNVSYMSEIRAQLAERRKLLGLYAPEKKEILSDTQITLDI